MSRGELHWLGVVVVTWGEVVPSGIPKAPDLSHPSFVYERPEVLGYRLLLLSPVLTCQGQELG